MERREKMARTNGDDDTVDTGYRLSITIDPSIRKKLRIAAAVHDMSIGEWCSAVLEKAADKAVPNMPTVKKAVEV
jgi:predicted HicB family RNase H-like nuclease